MLDATHGHTQYRFKSTKWYLNLGKDGNASHICGSDMLKKAKSTLEEGSNQRIIVHYYLG